MGIGSEHRRGEGKRGETSSNCLPLSIPSNLSCPPFSCQLPRAVFSPLGTGALLGAVQVHCVCLRNALYQAFYLLCLEERSSQQPACSCTALPMDRPALEVQAPPFHRMQEGVKRKKANEILWLKYTSLASPVAVRLMQGWLWLKMVLVRAGAGYGRGSGRPRGCVGAPLAKPPWDGGAPTLCEPKATPNTRIQGCCGSREASGWKCLVGPPWTGLFSSVWSLSLPGLVLKLIKCCRAL